MKIANKGDAASNKTTVRLELGGEFLAALDVPAIDPGSTATVTHVFDLPEGFSNVVAIVDEEGKVKESDESNNEREAAVEPPVDSGGDGGDGGGGGFKIPGPGLVPLLALLALAAVAMRRRK